MRIKSARPALGCIVLAAGGSTRLGRPKQLVRLRGKPLLARALRLAEAGAPIATVVVLGAGHFRLHALLERERRAYRRKHGDRDRRGRRIERAAGKVRVVRNPHWQTGLAGSLRRGIAALPQEAQAVLILLPDQARITQHDIVHLTSAWRSHPRRAAAALYAGRAGAPAIIPRRWFAAIDELQGDVGARHLLRAIGDVELVSLASAAFDLDTAEDLAALDGGSRRRHTRD